MNPEIPPRAPFRTRLYGVIVDTLFSIVFGIIFGYLFGSYSFSLLEPIRQSVGEYRVLGAIAGTFIMIIGPFIGIFFGVLVSFFLNSLMETFTGVTLGKIVFGLRVGDRYGKPASEKMLWRRWLVKNIPSFCFLISFFTPLPFFVPLGSIISFIILIGSLLVLTPSRQALHDIIAETAVYRRRDMR